MWKRVLATVASASVLVAGIARPGMGAAGPGDAPADAGSRVATDLAAADERVRSVASSRPIETGAQMLEERAASLAAAAARRAAEQAAAAAARAAAEAAARRAAEQAATQAAAEKAAAEQAAAAQAAAQAAAALQRAQKAVPLPPRAPAPPKPAAGPAVTWSTTVVDTGGQEAVNRCLGGLTHWYEDVDGKPYYPIDRACGGTPVLALRLGDHVRIDGAIWVVTDRRDVPKGSRYDAAAGLHGQILVQTCLRDDATMRIVALTAA